MLMVYEFAACRRQASCWIAARASRRSLTPARTTRASASPSAT